jgi:hypothetical protein
MAPFDEPEYVYRGGQEERREVIPPSRYEPSPQRRTDAEHFQMDSYAPLDSDYAYYPPAGAWDDLPQWNGSNAGARDYLPPVQSGRAGRTIDPNLPHICRTCRDFRPTESGDRGWCNNAYAFMHRRMVDADVLSCESSFGNWWLAHDGVWQKTADVSRHALETPLLDRLLGIQDYADPPHRSGSGR